MAALALALPLAAVFACDSTPSAGEAPDPGADPAPVVEPSPAPAEPPPVADPPAPSGPITLTPVPGADTSGSVYLVINTKGVVELDASGAKLILDKPQRNLQDLFVGPDGAVYLVDARSLRRLDPGGAVVEVASFDYDDVAPVDALALAPDGTIWATGSRGVGQRPPASKTWQLRTREELGLGYSSDVVFGFDGTGWLVGSTKLLRLGPGEPEWVVADSSALGKAPLVLHPTASPTGSVFATNGKQLIRLRDAKVEPTALPDAESLAYTTDLAVAADGSLALASGSCDLLRYGPDARGEPWKFGRDAYNCDTVEAMTLDARGRIWVASREGLSVIDRDGAVVEYPAGSFPAIAGRVSHIAVVGRGPELPEPPAVATMTLTGTILVEGKPLAKAAVEACPTVALQTEGSPCSVAKLRLTATTDARGQFRFEQAPIGDYGFAVEIGDQWRWSTPPSFAAQLRAGQAFELGELAFAKPQ